MGGVAVAVMAVSNPFAAQGWLAILTLLVSGLVLVLSVVSSLWASRIVARYRSENLEFPRFSKRLARAVRGLFWSGQWLSIAGLLALMLVFSMALPGQALLAALLVPPAALTLAALWWAMPLGGPEDAGLLAYVTPRELPARGSFATGWSFGGRLTQAREAAVSEVGPQAAARDFLDVLDAGGGLRAVAPSHQFHPFQVARLRAITAFPLLRVSLIFSVLAWPLAVVLPSGLLPGLPPPGDFFSFMESSVTSPKTEPDTTEPPQPSSADGQNNGGGGGANPDSGKGAVPGGSPGADVGGGARSASQGSTGQTDAGSDSANGQGAEGASQSAPGGTKGGGEAQQSAAQDSDVASGSGAPSGDSADYGAPQKDQSGGDGKSPGDATTGQGEGQETGLGQPNALDAGSADLASSQNSPQSQPRGQNGNASQEPSGQAGEEAAGAEGQGSGPGGDGTPGGPMDRGEAQKSAPPASDAASGSGAPSGDAAGSGVKQKDQSGADGKSPGDATTGQGAGQGAEPGQPKASDAGSTDSTSLLNNPQSQSEGGQTGNPSSQARPSEGEGSSGSDTTDGTGNQTGAGGRESGTTEKTGDKPDAIGPSGTAESRDAGNRADMMGADAQGGDGTSQEIQGAGSSAMATAANPAGSGPKNAPDVSTGMAGGSDAGVPLKVPVSGQGDKADSDLRVSVEGVAAKGDEVEVQEPRRLFADPGQAPALIEGELPARQSSAPSVQARPPRQRLPAWIADLYRQEQKR